MNIKAKIKREDIKNFVKGGLFKNIQWHYATFPNYDFNIIFEIENTMLDDLILTIRRDNFELMISLLENLANENNFNTFVKKCKEISRKGKKKVIYKHFIIQLKDIIKEKK